ncbi:MAG: molecular chaperone [Bacteroidetes bacterium]|nr:molecular chaperone [Bacteroidota bacterium]
MKSFSYTSIVCAFAALLLLVSTDAMRAQTPGDLLVTPTRVVFESGKRIETLTLINRGQDSATYRISLVQFRMKRDGSLERIDSVDPGQKSANDMIRFFPREVTIAPGESQNVRVQVRIPDSVAQGEYRSHIFFRGVPKQTALVPTADTSKNEFSVNLKAVYGVSLPVIVRNGNLKATVQISDIQLKRGDSSNREVLSLTFHREGMASVCGTVRVTFVPNSGESTQLASLGGVAIYTPNEERTFKMPIAVPSGLDLRNGRIKVEYLAISDASSEMLASGEAQIQ